MPRFFVEPSAIHDSSVTLTDDNAHHAAYSLRLAVGDHITVCDQQRVYDCILTHFDGQSVEASILSIGLPDTEPPYDAILFQALPKGDKLDSIIQKAVECGVSEIVPFESSRCVVHVKPEAETRKTERRCRIAEEAAKQSGRGVIPRMRETLTDYDAVLTEASACDLALFCYEGEGTQPITSVLNGMECGPRAHGEHPRIAIVIGSEGGFSVEEARKARAAGLVMTGLGGRILRTETASSFVLSCLSYRYEL